MALQSDPQPALPAVFKHTPLHERGIRLLSYVNGVPQSTPTLSCTAFDRVNAPPYTALSYEWGDSANQRNIILNGCEVKVNANLFVALKWLRGRLQGIDPACGTVAHIWIDALCIDQTNVKERNHQVKAMGETYSAASSVVAWLGGSGPPAGMLSSGRELTTQASGLVNSSYWTRMWIWQEILLSRSTHLMNWSQSMSMADFRNRLKLSTGQHGLARGQIPRLSQNLSSIMYRKSDFSLIEALVFFGDCKCREPQDKVFAVLNIIRREEKALLHMLPDYTFSPSKVVLIAIHHIRRASRFGQNDFSLRADTILHALGADDNKAIEALAKLLREQKVLLDRRAAEFWRAQNSTVPWKAPLISSEFLETRNDLLKQPISGMALSAASVFDCLFGWHQVIHSGGSSEWVTDIYEDSTPDIWSSDDIGAIA